MSLGLDERSHSAPFLGKSKRPGAQPTWIKCDISEVLGMFKLETNGKPGLSGADSSSPTP
jgi:hypothetical protein